MMASTATTCITGLGECADTTVRYARTQRQAKARPTYCVLLLQDIKVAQLRVSRRGSGGWEVGGGNSIPIPWLINMSLEFKINYDCTKIIARLGH